MWKCLKKVPRVPKTEELEAPQESCISYKPLGAPSLFPPCYCIQREGTFSYKMMISFQRSSELPIRFPVFLVSLGSPSTATSTNELIRGWRLCTLGFADTTGQEGKKKSRLSQRGSQLPPCGRWFHSFLLFLKTQILFFPDSKKTYFCKC